jgi:hypothetical protein
MRFPQDVVKLLVRQPNLVDRMRLELDAEYGIAEYAPGFEVIPDGLLLISRGTEPSKQKLGNTCLSRLFSLQSGSNRKRL